MKKLFALMLLCSLGVTAIGCDSGAKKDEGKKPAATENGKGSTPAPAPAKTDK